MVEKCSTARTGHVAGQEVLIASQPAAKKSVDVKKNQMYQTCPIQWTTDKFHFS